MSLRFKNETDALLAATALGAALSAANVEVVGLDLVQVQVTDTGATVATSDQQS